MHSRSRCTSTNTNSSWSGSRRSMCKASGMVCLRVPHDTIPGRRVTKVWAVAATTAALVELGDHLRCERVARVVVESTSDYWRAFYYLLEAAGLTVWLVNARR